MTKPQSAANHLARGRARLQDHHAHIINTDVIKKILQPCTIKNYDRSLRLWDEYVSDKPDTTVNVESLKQWILEMYLGINGIYDDPQGGLGTIMVYWKDFTAGCQHRRNLVIPKQLTLSTTNYIKGPLSQMLDIPARKRERKYGNMIHFMHLGTQLWQKDWHKYQKPRARIDLWAEIQSQVFTSARIGEYIESSCRPGSGKGMYYRDVIFGVFLNENGDPEFAIKIAGVPKNMSEKIDKRPEHPLHEGLTARPLFCNPILTFLAKFIAQGAFRDYNCIDELLDIVPPGDGEIFQIFWDPEFLEKPFFDRSDGSIESANTLSGRVRGLGLRAGYIQPPVVHDFRAEGLFLIDKMYSSAQRMKQAGQTDESTFGNFYQPNDAGVDGQGTYFGDKVRSIVSDRFRAMTLSRNSELWQSLPAEKQVELEDSPAFVVIEAELDALQSRSKDDIEAKEKRKELRALKRKLVAEALRDFQVAQPNTSLSRSTKDVQYGQQYSHFSRVRAIMPERDRLATSLFLVARIRSVDGRAALQDLIALYCREVEVDVHPGLTLDECHCSDEARMQLFTQKSAAECWRHIYGCQKKHLRQRRDAAEFCFLCNTWVEGLAAWENHCQIHLNLSHSLPLQCNPFTYCKTLATPGLCPFCLGDESIPKSERFHQFLSGKIWIEHLEEHFNLLSGSEINSCPFPNQQCAVFSGTLQDLKFHFHDAHGAKLSRVSKRRRTGEPEDIEGGKRDAKRKKIRAAPGIRHDSIFIQEDPMQWSKGIPLVTADPSWIADAKHSPQAKSSSVTPLLVANVDPLLVSVTHLADPLLGTKQEIRSAPISHERDLPREVSVSSGNDDGSAPGNLEPGRNLCACTGCYNEIHALEQERECTVEKILGDKLVKRKKRKVAQYLVKFEGYCYRYNEWLEARNIGGDALKVYKIRRL